MTDSDPAGWFRRLQARLGQRLDWLIVLVLVAVASIIVRLLADYEFDHSALLYVGLPYLIAVSLVFALKPSQGKWWASYADFSLKSMIVMLGSSVVLFEGFICVLFFIPIYVLGVSIVFAIAWHKRTGSGRGGRALASLLPLIALGASLEGTSETLSFNRAETVEVQRVVDLTPDEILAHLAQPIALPEADTVLMSVFPMPYRVDAGSLSEGDVHTVYTRYHRWFVTNTHEGHMRLRIREVAPDRVVTDFIEDTTYFSTYLALHQSRIALQALDARSTRITLSIDYTRKLDPAWYFGPLQRYAVSEMGDYLIREIMVRDAAY